MKTWWSAAAASAKRGEGAAVMLLPSRETRSVDSFAPPSWGRCRAQRGGGGSGARIARNPPSGLLRFAPQTTSPTLGEESERRIHVREHSFHTAHVGSLPDQVLA